MSRSDATILHADLDSFFASVEQRDDPALRGRPVIVGGGVVLAASYEAKAYGVRTAMGGHEALRRCPDAVVVPARFQAYTDASKAVFEVFDDTTPFVEGISIDEAFLDVGGLWRTAGTPLDIAVGLRHAVRERVGLAITVGIARTKFLAKVASAAAKPDGLLLVPPDGESAFLHPLPVEAVWGVGAKTAAKLHARGIDTVGDMARVGAGPLTTILGSHAGRHLHALATHQDPRHVQRTPRRRSIGSQSALGRRRRSAAELDAVLVGIVDRVTGRMRKAERVGRTVTLRFRFDDFTRATRSHTTPAPTAETAPVLAVARALLASAQPMIDERGLTLLGMAVGNLDDDGAVQLALPFDHQAGGALDHTIDDIREKFGPKALTRTVLLGRDHMAMPMLPID
jgi:DNA polymerase-4